MHDYPFNFDTLFNFSNSNHYLDFDNDSIQLFDKLNHLKKTLNFPAVNNDVGNMISFLVQLSKSKIIFEMGSGYGHSAFWYQLYSSDFIENIFLTEKREDLILHFNSLPWREEFKSKLDYYQGDAFDKLAVVSNIDFLLIDGVKSDYLRFLEVSFDKLSDNAIVLIDNSYWRGSFLDEKFTHKKSAKNILELHDYLKTSKKFQSVFIPYKDGVSLLRKLPT